LFRAKKIRPPGAWAPAVDSDRGGCYKSMERQEIAAFGELRRGGSVFDGRGVP